MNDSIPPTLVSLNAGPPRIFLVQFVLILGASGVFYFYQGIPAAQAAIFGGFIALFNLWTMTRRVQMATEVAKIAPGREVNVLYVGAIQRFVFTLIFFGVGMGWLQLLPMPMITTFAVAQIGYLFNGHSTFKSVSRE